MSAPAVELASELVRDAAVRFPGEKVASAIQRAAELLDLTYSTAFGLYYGRPSCSEERARALLRRQEDVLRARLAQSEQLARKLSAETEAIRQALAQFQGNSCETTSDTGQPAQLLGSALGLAPSIGCATQWQAGSSTADTATIDAAGAPLGETAWLGGAL